ncbi:nicotinamide-nucleotide amidohydrolase family protein [Opitutaceae bacterium TAV4]|nr:nicotinamide-nucleotide amidohydrolase family protein [Opitutaceae bacterium TAV4]RRJ98779.1 nicotinamide-nucleotide amidohydrolase family protein [Opitutaceae bacterium TAV3]
MSSNAEALALSAEIKTLALGSAPTANLFTIAAAESLTVGRVQTLLGLVSGSSEYFLGGATAYSPEQKEKLFGVPLSESQPCAGVSESIARQLASGARQRFGADIAVATTGFAEPAPKYGAAHPMAWWSVAWKASVSSTAPGAPRIPHASGDPENGYTLAACVEFPGHTRAEAQEATALAAATALRNLLRSLRAQ